VKGTAKAQSVTVAGNQRTATLHGLVGGQSYTFRVYAFNQFGSGPTGTSSAVTPSGAASTYASTVLADHPAVYWRFTERSASYAGYALYAADSSGHGVFGTYSSCATLGAAGSAPGNVDALANDSDPGISVDCGGGFGAASDGGAGLPAGAGASSTVEGWYRSAQGGGCDGTLAGTGQYAIYLHPNLVTGNCASDEIDVAGAGAAVQFLPPTGHPFYDGNWHYVAAVYQANTGLGPVVSLYFDGRSLGTHALTVGGSAGPLQAGGGCSQGCRLTGGIDEVAVYPAALSAARIAAHFTASGRVAAANHALPPSGAPPRTSTKDAPGYAHSSSWTARRHGRRRSSMGVSRSAI
jgi:hypothetical protein